MIHIRVEGWGWWGETVLGLRSPAHVSLNGNLIWTAPGANDFALHCPARLGEHLITITCNGRKLFENKINVAPGVHTIELKWEPGIVCYRMKYGK